MSLIKKWGTTNLGLAFFSILIVMILLEILLGFTHYKFLIIEQPFPKNYFKADPVLGYDIKENFKKSPAYLMQDNFEYEIWSNELDCFDLPYKGERDYILLVGDSFSQCCVKFEDQLGTVIEKSIDYRVLKCGITGYGTKQELIKAKQIISQVNSSPKLIIVGYYMNDMQGDYLFPEIGIIAGNPVGIKKFANYTNPETGEITSRNSAEVEEMSKRWEKYCTTVEPSNPTSTQIKCWLNRHSILYKLTRVQLKESLLNVALIKDLMIKSGIVALPSSNQISKVIPPYLEYYSFYKAEDYPWLKRAWADHLENIKEFKEFADQNGAKLLFVIIPTKEQVYPFLNPDQKKEFVDIEYPNKILHLFFEKEGIDYLDLLPNFSQYSNQSNRKWLDSENDLFYKFDGHWNRKGTYLAGSLSARYILENNLLNVSGKDKKLNVVMENIENFH